MIALAGLLVLLVAALVVIGVRAWKRSRVTPEERERRRRSSLAAHGKMGDANIVEIRDQLLFFAYSVGGLEYTASQDMSALHDYLPTDLSLAIGAVYVKYDPHNPANSVVLSEEWSGFNACAPQPHQASPIADQHDR